MPRNVTEPNINFVEEWQNREKFVENVDDHRIFVRINHKVFYDGNAEVYLGDLSFLGIFPGRDDGPGNVHDFRRGGRHGKRGADRWGEHHDSGEKGDRDGNGCPGEI